ncbi:WXG100 family type VII secretion target [Nocardia wallacei]|uniref:WXG100 family type VII secretion target n=1 Tax=Nocardia wallacei TaxID=480035 RepID=UPI002453DA26|nr:hypothetical protein [Nocardia wallacei]
MATKLGVTPHQLRKAAGDMGDLRDRVQGILDKLERSVGTKENAWGKDSYGATFAEGPQGYIASHENLRVQTGNVAETLGSYSTGQYRAADLLEKQDHF